MGVPGGEDRGLLDMVKRFALARRAGRGGLERGNGDRDDSLGGEDNSEDIDGYVEI